MSFDWLIGGSSRLPFSILLSLRSQISDRFIVSGLTVLAVAASVALAMSVEVASRGLQDELRTTTQALIGSAALTISAGEVGVPEAVVEQVEAVPGVLGASPLIRRTFRVASGPEQGRALHVIGLDLLGDNEVRRYDISRAGVFVRDPVRLLALPDSIVVSAKFAAELDVGDGDRLALSLDGAPVELVVRGVLGGEMADAFGGQIAAMDIYALQQVVGMIGRFERIDVAVESDQQVEETAVRIEAAIEPGLSIGRDMERESFGLALLRTYQRFLWAIVFVALATSALLTYAVSSMSIDRRLEELSLLRAAGMEGARVGRVVLADALVVATAGTVLGILAAPFVTRAVGGVLSIGSALHYGVDLSEARLSLRTVAMGLLVGFGSVIAAAVPAASRATRIRPLELMDLGHGSVREARTRQRAVGVTVASAAVLVIAWLETPIPSGIRVLAVILAGIGFAAGLGHRMIAWGITPADWLTGLVPRVGFLIGPSLGDRVVESALALAAWAAIAACVVSGATTIRSYAGSIDGHYYGLYGESAVLLLAGDPFGTSGMQPISSATIDALRANSVVEDVAAPRSIQLPFRGVDIALASFPTETISRRGELGFISPDPEATRTALTSGELVMNESFAERFRLRVGDRVSLPTLGGARSFRLGATVRGMAGPNGSLYLDESAFDEMFSSSAAEHWVAALWVKPPEEDSLAILRRSETSQELFLLRGKEARRFAARSTEKYRAMLSVPLAIGCGLGLVSLSSLLFGATRSRQREFALLRAAGATRANVVAIITLGGSVVGVVGAVAGIVIGAIWSSVFCRFLSESIGWRIVPLFTVDLAATVLAGAAVMAVLGSLIPALLSTRTRELVGSQTP